MSTLAETLSLSLHPKRVFNFNLSSQDFSKTFLDDALRARYDACDAVALLVDRHYLGRPITLSELDYAKARSRERRDVFALVFGDCVEETPRLHPIPWHDCRGLSDQDIVRICLAELSRLR